MGVGDRRRHQNISLIGRVTEHQALVTGSLFLVGSFIYALGYIGGLLADGVQNRAGSTIEAKIRTVVANVQDHVAAEVFEIDPGGGGYFASQYDHTGLHHGFARDPCIRVRGNDRVEHGIRNLIRDLVRMTLGYGFRRERGIACHGDLHGFSRGRNSTVSSCRSPVERRDITSSSPAILFITALSVPVSGMPSSCWSVSRASTA